jgi:prepilin-type N-terminal cleavage/methylation domain-containing protein
MQKNKKNKGFTMIEITIATSILSIIFGGMTIFGIQIVKNNQRNQILKNTLENISYTIEFVNKVARMSHEVEESSNRLFIKDNVTRSSYCYYFDDDKLKRRTGGTDCSGVNGSDPVVAGNDVIEVSGKFEVVETDRNNNKRGLVKINIVLENKTEAIDEVSGGDKMVIQSLVSLRDYGFYDNI